MIVESEPHSVCALPLVTTDGRFDICGGGDFLVSPESDSRNVAEDDPGLTTLGVGCCAGLVGMEEVCCVVGLEVVGCVGCCLLVALALAVVLGVVVAFFSALVVDFMVLFVVGAWLVVRFAGVCLDCDWVFVILGLVLVFGADVVVPTSAGVRFGSTELVVVVALKALDMDCLCLETSE